MDHLLNPQEAVESAVVLSPAPRCHFHSSLLALLHAMKVKVHPQELPSLVLQVPLSILEGGEKSMATLFWKVQRSDMQKEVVFQQRPCS